MDFDPTGIDFLLPDILRMHMHYNIQYMYNSFHKRKYFHFVVLSDVFRLTRSSYC